MLLAAFHNYMLLIWLVPRRGIFQASSWEGWEGSWEAPKWMSNSKGILLQRLPTYITDWWEEDNLHLYPAIQSFQYTQLTLLPLDQRCILSGHPGRHRRRPRQKDLPALQRVAVEPRVRRWRLSTSKIDAKCFLGVPWGTGGDWPIVLPNFLKYPYHGFEDMVTRGLFFRTLLRIWSGLATWQVAQLPLGKHQTCFAIFRPSDTSLQNSQVAERKLDNMKVNHAVPPEWGFQYLHGGPIISIKYARNWRCQQSTGTHPAFKCSLWPARSARSRYSINGSRRTELAYFECSWRRAHHGSIYVIRRCIFMIIMHTTKGIWRLYTNGTPYWKHKMFRHSMILHCKHWFNTHLFCFYLYVYPLHPVIHLLKKCTSSCWEGSLQWGRKHQFDPLVNRAVSSLLQALVVCSVLASPRSDRVCPGLHKFFQDSNMEGENNKKNSKGKLHNWNITPILSTSS